MAQGLRGASQIINKLSYSPIAQKQLKSGLQQEGMDNRAVSQQDRMLGKQVAGEQERLMALDKAGQDLSTRKDKLAFARKVQDTKESQFQQKMSMAEDQFSHNKFKGMTEGVLGLASIGTNTWGRIKQKERDKKYLKTLEENNQWARKSYGLKPVTDEEWDMFSKVWGDRSYGTSVHDKYIGDY
jgi:hypothetical protein